MSTEQEDTPKHDSSWIYHDDFAEEDRQPDIERPVYQPPERPFVPRFPKKPREEDDIEWAPGRRLDRKKRKGGFIPGL